MYGACRGIKKEHAYIEAKGRFTEGVALICYIDMSKVSNTGLRLLMMTVLMRLSLQCYVYITLT